MARRVKKRKKRKQKVLELLCDQAILDTLSYRTIFKSMLSFHQLSTYLFSRTPKNSDLLLEIDRPFFEDRLNTLVKKKKVKHFRGKYHVNKQKPFSWNIRVKNSKKHLKKVSSTLGYLAQIKWIKMIAVSGSVAAHSAKKKDDIDIFIVTEKNRLWLTRFFTVLILKALNKYRTDEDFDGKVCPNIFVADQSLAWPLKKRNEYTAHEILLLHPILNRDNTYFDFIKANKWALKYFPKFNVNLAPKPNLRAKKKPKYNSSLINHLDFVFMLFQFWYMRKRRVNEVTTRDLIHFNKKDHSEGIMKKFVSILK